MKNFMLCTILLLAFCFQSNAQASGLIWIGSKSADPNANAVHTFITQAYDAFIAGDEEKAWAAYADDAAEIDPVGSVTFGKKALREAWDGFMKIADETPKFKYENVQVRMLTNDIALVIWDSETDIKVGGQQMGGKAKGMAVVRKIKGQWKIEFDSITPILGMPALDATKSN